LPVHGSGFTVEKIKDKRLKIKNWIPVFTGMTKVAYEDTKVRNHEKKINLKD